MIYRNGLTIHETPTHDIETPVLPKDYKHPTALTCGHCGAQFNTGCAVYSHKTSTHYPLPYLFSDWGDHEEIT